MKHKLPQKASTPQKASCNTQGRFSVLFSLLMLLYGLSQNVAAQDNWRPVPGSGTTQTLRGVTFFNVDTGFAVGNNGVILRTFNGGNTWTNVGPPQAMENHNSSRKNSELKSVVVVGDSGTIRRTTTMGEVWNQPIRLTSANLYGVTEDGLNYDPNIVYTCGDSGVILKSIDDGVSWTRQFTPVTTQLRSITFFNPDTGIAVGQRLQDGQTGIVLRTLNGGAEWIIIDSGRVSQKSETQRGFEAIALCANYCNHNSSRSNKGGLAVVGGGDDDGGRIRRSTDFGLTWTAIPGGTTSSLLSLAVSDSNWVAIGDNGAILSSADNGLTWSRQTSRTSETLYAVAVGIKEEGVKRVGIAVGSGGTIIKTQTPGFTIISPAQGDTLCAGSQTTITWTGGNPSWNVLIWVCNLIAWQSCYVFTAGTPNDGSEVWNIPATFPPGNYQIYIQELNYLDWTYSGTFTIAACPSPPLNITSPALGDTVCAGTSQTITWSGGTPGWNASLRVVYVPTWTNAGVIASSIPTNGSQLWNIPLSFAPGSYQIYIQDDLSNVSLAYSGTFTIAACPPQLDCPNNIVQNWSFINGAIPGPMPSPGQATNWTRSYGTPDVALVGSCGDSAFIGMWGNQVVGEALQQTTPLIQGGTYEISFCARWSPELGRPYPVQFTFRASNVSLTSPQDLNGELIGVSQPITSQQNWVTVTLPNWTATGTFSILTISATNQSSFNHGDSTSYGHIDRVCIHRVGTTGCVSPPDSMVGWWPGDNNATDISGFGNNGTLQGNATYGAGKVANAFFLINAADYVLVPDDPELDFGLGNMTVDAWIRTSNPDGNTLTIVDKRSGTPSNPIGYTMFLSQGKLGFQLGNGSPTFNNVSDNFSMLNDGNWHHVAVAVERNSSTGGKMYVDGQLDYTFNPINRIGNISNSGNLLIGQHIFGSPRAFNGWIDEVELFNRALDSTEIRSIWDADSLGKCKPDTVTDVLESERIPERFELMQCYPNPFNPTTTIGFWIPNSGFVSLKIYDILGREVAVLVNQEMQPGAYKKTFNSQGFPSGIYFYRIHAGSFIDTNKMILLK